MFRLALIALLLSPLPAMGETIPIEMHKHLMCHTATGANEHRIGELLPVQVTVDCADDKFVYEVSFAKDWTTALGNALYKSNLTSRQPVVILIEERPGDSWYETEMRATIRTSGIKATVNTVQAHDPKVRANLERQALEHESLYGPIAVGVK